MQDLDEHVFIICAEFEVKKKLVSSFYKENNFKPCLTKQLLNMFKLWCERGISLFWELRDKEILKNLQFWPESLGAMIEYWYIERGLFHIIPHKLD